LAHGRLGTFARGPIKLGLAEPVVDLRVAACVDDKFDRNILILLDHFPGEGVSGAEPLEGGVLADRGMPVERVAGGFPLVFFVKQVAVVDEANRAVSASKAAQGEGSHSRTGRRGAGVQISSRLVTRLATL
jgi:hypothetical protein